MKIEKEYIDYKKIHSRFQNSAELISKLNNFEKIIVITRGGMGVASILSQYIKTRWFDTLCIASYTDQKQQSELQTIKVNESKEKVLLVDDIVDTGDTIIEAKKYFPNSEVFCLHYKPKKTKIVPEYFLWETDKWIVYPWEE